ncbi:hypothetical protein [Diaphorobacter aerolatus]|uniref:Uncharacterized protein n=1 Tax=Diaphorobacter aerolatus TaxID=1288495 RepID=A0A7H0GL48_9BURK|nr:hypothetical protein [Diaphorobacter aerolatus]QNP49014.1 hypothetical protein H9K75_02260 [Diaphorobacter aerolatus]
MLAGCKSRHVSFRNYICLHSGRTCPAQLTQNRSSTVETIADLKPREGEPMQRKAFAHFGKNACASTLVLGAFILGGSAHAAQTCSTSINNTSVSGDVTVQGNCTIENSNVEGAITMRPGATLLVRNSTVSGPVSGDKVKSLVADGSNLNKGLAITGGVDSVKFVNSAVTGAAATFSGARSIELHFSIISESLAIKDGPTRLTLNSSTIEKGLSCQGAVNYKAEGSTVTGPMNC